MTYKYLPYRWPCTLQAVTKLLDNHHHLPWFGLQHHSYTSKMPSHVQYLLSYIESNCKQQPTHNTIRPIWKRRKIVCNRICVTRTNDDVVLSTGEQAGTSPVGVFHSYVSHSWRITFLCPTFLCDQFTSAGHVLFNTLLWRSPPCVACSSFVHAYEKRIKSTWLLLSTLLASPQSFLSFPSSNSSGI